MYKREPSYGRFRYGSLSATFTSCNRALVTRGVILEMSPIAFLILDDLSALPYIQDFPICRG